MSIREKEPVESGAVRSALIVEDQEIVVRSFTRVLQLTGVADVRVAWSAAEAAAKVETDPPEMLLVDIKLDAGSPDGIHFLRNARDRGYGGLVVVISGDSSQEQFFRAAWAGANDYLVKDGVDDLPAELRRIMSRRIDYSEVEWRHVAVLELGYLRSWGLSERYIGLLERWVALDFPRYEELAQAVGLSYDHVKKCFAEIFSILDVANPAQLADILRTCTMFKQRWGACMSTLHVR